MLHLLPKRGDKSEWQHTQDYWLEKDELPEIDLDDPIFVYR
jgi:DNA-directed RNA polymerase subunit H (RpoH/RPB5)